MLPCKRLLSGSLGFDALMFLLVPGDEITLRWRATS
jgi:hypothetical protein